ncbi:MAG: toxin-antitoxin system HicB family antitoxin [Anaerolineales bacterium]|jgi:antitoxin HicB
MNKDVDYYLSLPYTVELIPEPQEGWFVAIKELPGCMTDSDTPEEALKEIREIQREWLEIAIEEGVDIPEPRADEDYSGRFNLRVPRSLHRRLVETAEREGVSLNQYINDVLAGAVAYSQSVRYETKDVRFAKAIADADNETLPGYRPRTEK